MQRSVAAVSIAAADAVMEGHERAILPIMQSQDGSAEPCCMRKNGIFRVSEPIDSVVVAGAGGRNADRSAAPVLERNHELGLAIAVYAANRRCGLRIC